MEKIIALKKALENIGVTCELYTDAEWYCIDNKTHYGIELVTDIPIPEQEMSFCFTPQGRYITDCRLAPTKR